MIGAIRAVLRSAGYWDGEGVSVQYPVTGSATRHLEELLRGTYDIGLQQNDGIVRSVEGGADLFIFLPMAHLPVFSLIAAQPRPKVTPVDLRQVIDMVWEAEGYKTPPGAPEKYFDPGYLQIAGGESSEGNLDMRWLTAAVPTAPVP